MKKHIVVMIIFTCAVFAAATALGGEMTGSMSKDVLIGSTVQNSEGKHLGKISDVSLDNQGNIRFVILSHRGMTGAEESLIPIPLNAVSFREDKLAIVNISEDRLNAAPSISADSRPDMTNRAWVEETSRFFGVRPYWDESGMEQEMEEPMHESGEMEDAPGK